jgi:hypothetical protein
MPLEIPEMRSEAEDIRTIIDYLGISQSSSEAKRITGLTKSGLSEVLAGRRRRDTSRRVHIAVVAAIVRGLSAARLASTGERERGRSAIGWLHAGRVDTSVGRRSPLDVLSDDALAVEALDDLWR